MPKRVDQNQKAIVQALRQVGATVQILSMVGKGCPDLLCGYKGSLYLLELKDGAKPLSAQRLTPDEMKFHEEWAGLVWTVNSIEHALRVVGAIE
jgi:hypothetical protein